MQKSFFLTKFFLIMSLFYINTCLSFVDDKKEEFEIPLTEDLMREHGILNRVLLVYEEIIKRINNNTNFSLSTLKEAILIIESFIGNYHEKLEEDYIFPLFEKNKKEIRLIKTLKNQHIKGREITAKLKDIVTKNKILEPKNKSIIKSLLQKCISMYRPHEARENTVLFPKIRSLMSKEKFKELSEKFEDLEHKIFGENGFEKMVKRVTLIEKDLGIYQLEQFTPKIIAQKL